MRVGVMRAYPVEGGPKSPASVSDAEEAVGLGLADEGGWDDVRSGGSRLSALFLSALD